MPEAGLDTLRDLHLPAPVGWWPPAPGWWLLGLLLLAALLAAALVGRHLARRPKHYRKAALAELERLHARYQREGDPRRFAQDVSTLLKRAALKCYPAAEVAPLSGEAWAEFLTRDAPAAQASLRATLASLHSGAEVGDVEALHQHARDWLASREGL